jgi:PAS domain S-box-containing protein
MINGLRFRLTLIFIGLAVSPAILVGAIIGQRSYSDLQEQNLVLQHEVASSARIEIMALFEGWENDLLLLDDVYRIGAIEYKEQRTILNTMLLSRQAYQEIALLNTEGMEIIRLSRSEVFLEDDLESRSENEEFQFPFLHGTTYISTIRFDDTIREPLITISIPLFDRHKGRIESVLVADLRIKTIWDLVANIDLPNKGIVYVVDQTGRVVAHRNPAIVLSGTTIALPVREGRVEGLSGMDVIITSEYLQLGDQTLFIVGEQPASAGLEKAINSLRITVVITSSALALALILVVFITRQIVKPIEKLSASTQAISGGDFSQQVEIPPINDEIADLSHSFNIMARALKDREEKLQIQNVTLQTEIATRVRAGEAMRESQKNLQTLFDSIDDFLFILDEKGNIVRVNPVVQKRLGYLETELLNRSILQVHPPDRRDEAAAIVANILAGKINSCLIPLMARDCTLIPVETKITHGIWDGRNALFGISRDISERKRTENVLIASQKMAGIGRLAAGMAHEINSPLQLVTGLSERLTRQVNADDIEKEQYLTDLGRINKSGWRIANIIRSLLTYARQTANEIDTHQLNEIIEETLFMIEHQMKSWDNITIRKELAQDLPPIRCDGNTITQVIINLLENARDAMLPDGGKITIRTGYDDRRKHLILQIHNTGDPIPAEIQSKIFEPFFTTKEIGKGTGLGLSIVHGIIAAHGGEIAVESNPAEGTTFNIQLPEEPPPADLPVNPGENHSRYDS